MCFFKRAGRPLEVLDVEDVFQGWVWLGCLRERYEKQGQEERDSPPWDGLKNLE